MRELGASLSRNKSMTISLVVTMSVSLLLAALGLLIQEQADRTERYFGDRLQLQVSLCTDTSKAPTCIGGAATEAQKEAVQQALDDNPEVEEFEVRTAQENYERAQETFGQSETGRKQLEVLSPDSFSDSYFVTLKDPQEFDGVTSQVSGMDGVNSVLSLRDLLDSLFIALEKLQWAAIGTALLLILAAVLQVSNTIRMTAHARRREISIMRYVGASSWHIQLPFLLESMVAAVISAALAAAGIAAFMGFVVYGFLRDKLQITTWVRWQEAFVVMGWTSLLAVALALLPTLLLTRKYLKV
ncbi:permease-like cell division protein FtsX [Aeromicrobium sp. Leaf350]|uniref:permease-like cell division protein FtsX n=1 Tax=Aeromicrobium sp. Leaf350 TaxID=2876565 RepID=UPI001E4FC512|nr:permease-like cell division protein FtsX [Aeromicrobium sp. Leaf350]